MDLTHIRCLFSHICSMENHAFGFRLQAALRGTGIDLLIDPFHLGDDVELQINGLELDAMILLWGPQSLMSEVVSLQVQAAELRAIPFFVAVPEGLRPTNLESQKVFESQKVWFAPPIGSPQFQSSVIDLGRTIRARAGLQRTLERLGTDNAPQTSREAAERLALDFDTNLLAESLPALAKQYARVEDPATRYWIALAIGAVGSRSAAELLNSFSKEDHPLVLEAIRQAQGTIKSGT